MAKYVYPAIFHLEKEGGYSVEFPDLPCSTQGEDLSDAIDMAEDALALLLYSYEEDNIDIPKPTDIRKIKSKDSVSFVCCDTFEYRKQFNNKAVKKTLSIPEWLNEKAMEANINFSQVLQDALKEKLNAFVHSPATSKYLQDAIDTMRNGRYVLPVKAEARDEL